MNPLRYLRPAVYAALSSPAPVLNGQAVTVRAYGGGVAPAYVLLNPDLDTCNKTLDGRACKQWDCTFLVDVVTLHANDRLSVALADELADLLSERMDNVRLSLAGGLQVTRASVEQVNSGSRLDGEQVDIHRYLRLRYSVSYNTPAAPELLGVLDGALDLTLA